MADPKQILKAKYPTRVDTLLERSDVDPHEKFNPEDLGMEEWDDGFFVNPEPVLIERGPAGNIIRTTPISEAPPEKLFPSMFKDGELIETDPIPKPTAKRPKEQVVEMLAGLLMRYYGSLKPGQIAYNPLYDGIPASVAMTDPFVLQPDVRGDTLVHVPAHEVHQWLKQLIYKRATVRSGSGFQGDISDLTVHISR